MILDLEQSQKLDRDFLKTWIQPQHLEEKAMREARAFFEQHPSHIVRLSAFLHEELADKLSHLLANDVELRRVRKLYNSSNPELTPGEFRAADQSDRFFEMSQMSDLALKEGAQPGLNVLAYVKFRQFLFDPRFASFLRALTGLELVAPTTFAVNSLAVGDFIGSHTDVHCEPHQRRLAFILYLSPDWKPEFGGALHILSHQGENSVWEVEYNSFAVFDVFNHQSHEVKPVLPSAGALRRTSFNGWFSEQADGESMAR